MITGTNPDATRTAVEITELTRIQLSVRDVSVAGFIAQLHDQIETGFRA
jgi:hypothetical protein